MDMTLDILEQFYDKKAEDFDAEDVIKIVDKWKESVLSIDQFLYEDAKKEFSMTKMTGFGVDGESGARELDFAQVRGEFEENDTVKEIKLHMSKKENLGNEIVEQMKKTIHMTNIIKS